MTTRLAKGDRIVNGNGADTDIVIASAKSYLNALNKLHSSLERSRPRAASDPAPPAKRGSRRGRAAVGALSALGGRVGAGRSR